jgi:hypothetical protein
MVRESLFEAVTDDMGCVARRAAMAAAEAAAGKA